MADTVLIRSHNYKRSGVQGNCGAAFISRLNGTYSSKEQQETEYRLGIQHRRLRAISENSIDLMTINQLIHRIYLAEGVANTSAAKCRPYPLHWAFADVLEATALNHPALVGMTDTHGGSGDGHRGAFATRHFAEWIEKNGLAKDINRTDGLRYGKRRVFGWWVFLDYNKVTQYLSQVRAEIQAAFKEWNSEEKLLEMLSDDETNRQEMASRFEDGWRDYFIVEEGVLTSESTVAPAIERFNEILDDDELPPLPAASVDPPEEGVTEVTVEDLRRAADRLARERIPTDRMFFNTPRQNRTFDELMGRWERHFTDTEGEATDGNIEETDRPAQGQR